MEAHSLELIKKYSDEYTQAKRNYFDSVAEGIELEQLASKYQQAALYLANMVETVLKLEK